MISTIAALSAALALQTAAPQKPSLASLNELPPEQAEQILASMSQIFYIYGSCESIFPPEAKQELVQQIESDGEEFAFLLEAWTKGSASPEAANPTVDSCLERIMPALENLMEITSELTAEIETD